MPDIDLHNSYNSSGLSVHDFFGRQEEGFFVPIYQRDYTWEEENINRLFEDLLHGIEDLAGEGGDHATTFLGTAILTNLADRKQSVKPGDDRAQPTAVKMVVDGQQRIATIALLSIQLTAILDTLDAKLPETSKFEVLKFRSKDMRGLLRRLYTFQTGLGAAPPEKPKIIREAEDRWELAGDDSSYKSPVAQYIAAYIRTNNCENAQESLDTVSGARIIGNVNLIRSWLDDICHAHVPDSHLNGTFPVGALITTSRMQEYVIGVDDPNVYVGQIIQEGETDENKPEYAGVAMYQLLLFSYYLLRRCGINQLDPTQPEWGFDMFQALNSTGTPLTALETFKPVVIQSAGQEEGKDWQTSVAKGHFDEMEELFENTRTNEQKNRRTNELLTAARLCFDGVKLGNKFSAQHRWIQDVYGRPSVTATQRTEFLEKLARLASFYYTAWYMEDENKPHLIRAIEDHNEGQLASILVQYLREASSELSAPVLARFFAQIQDSPKNTDEFVEAVKACAAFFTLWRSSNSTSGLDQIYRKFFHGSKTPVKVESHCWTGGSAGVSSSDLKKYFSEVLANKGIGDKESWIAGSQRFLLFNELKTVCRFVLFLAGDDRIADPGQGGLTSLGNKGVCDLLNLGRWKSTDHRSLEHVAPQSPPQGHSWDSGVYSGSRVHEVGNLLLLPADINNFVDRKSWVVKYLHYCHIGSRSQEEIESYTSQAQERGVVLSKKAIQKLSSSQFSCVVEPILQVGIDGNWDANLIDKRTRQIKEIAWERLNTWLTT